MEGPLSIHGNARELMKLLPAGEQIFEVITRYDRLLAREHRHGHEPGDALAFVAPFLIHHGLSSDDIGDQANNAAIVAGARELIAGLTGWKVFCITASYEQYASRVMDRVGIARQNLACTSFAIDRYRTSLSQHDRQVLADVERDIVAMHDGEERMIMDRLDRFYLEELPLTSLAPLLREVRPIGGARKLAALEGFAASHGRSLAHTVAVGDSVTDAAMLHAVNMADGLAIAFNADGEALPRATIALASTHLSDLLPVLDAWRHYGRDGARKVVLEKERAGGLGDRHNLHWLVDRSDLRPVIETHQRIRRIVLQQTGKAR